MTSLIEISDEYKNIFGLLYSNDEVDNELVEQQFESISQDFNEKAINIGMFYISLQHELEEMKIQQKKIIEGMKNKIDRFEKKNESIRNYLKFNMKNINKKSIKSPLIDIILRKNPASTIIDDESKIDDKYKKIKQVESIDKNLIKSDIKSGLEVIGAHLEEGESLIVNSVC